MGNNHSNFSKNAWKSCVCKYMLSICINLEHHVWHQPVYMTRFLNQWIMVLCLCDHDFGLYCIHILATHYSPLMSFEGKTPHLPRDVKHKKNQCRCWNMHRQCLFLWRTIRALLSLSEICFIRIIDQYWYICLIGYSYLFRYVLLTRYPSKCLC